MTARATIDFFAHQRAARRRTALLLVWFALALAAVIVLVYAALLLPLLVSSHGLAALWHPRLLAGTALAVLGTTAGGVAYHARTLARGEGEALARSLGAVLVEPGDPRPELRRLVNVVEEMAIASGLPVPRVFLLGEEDAINAFAAGATPGHALVAVTRGAIERLDRDELQGVVAHEFSHILNGDSRLNAQLMGMLGGLTIIHLFGREALRLAWPDGRDDWRGRLVLFPPGLVLALAGSIGVLCGQLVRCGVSRQREYLADAAAAQLTRNPAGLARALAAIRDHRSALRATRALEASHFFFANAVEGAFARWLATHPPLEERIRRLDPSLGLEAVVRERIAEALQEPPEAARAGSAPDAMVSAVGAPHAAHLDRAGELLAALPPAVASAARDPEGARALVLALALSTDGDLRRARLRAVPERDPVAPARLDGLVPAVGALTREQRLVALDLALPALDALPFPAVAALNQELVSAYRGESLTVFDWMLQRLVVRRLERRLSGVAPRVRYRALEQVQVECLQLISLVAWAGTLDADAAQAALTAALRELAPGERWRILPRERLGVAVADAALRQLDLASPDLKRRILRACTASIAVDARVTTPEAELLRAISASLGCPMPPLLPGTLGVQRPVAL